MAQAASLRERLHREHIAALDRFVALASEVEADRWAAEPVPGKWSPAQVTEHVFLAYEALLRELHEGTPMRIRTKWWHRVLLRSVVLPRILRSGRIPPGVRAPRELRPLAAPGDPMQTASIEKLIASARRVDEELARRGKSVRITHPYFGTLRGVAVLRFCAIHTSHHAKQLPKGGVG